jgi:hypothetical protein
LNAFQALSPKDLATAREVLRHAAPVVAKLHEGAGRPRCRFPLNYDVEEPIGLPHLWHVKVVGAKLMALSARVNLQRGDADAALEDCAVMVRLAHANDLEPDSIPMMVGAAIKSLSRIQVAAVLNESTPSAEGLRGLLGRFGDPEDRGPLT